MHTPSARRLTLASPLVAVIAALALSLLATEAAAQPYTYVMQQRGNVLFDTTLLDKQPGVSRLTVSTKRQGTSRLPTTHTGLLGFGVEPRRRLSR